MKFKNVRMFFTGIVIGATTTLPIRAQSALYRLDGEKEFKLVHKMEGRVSFIVNPSPSDSGGGNVMPRYRLQPVEEYFPALVSVKVSQAKFSRAGLDSVHRLDQRFAFTAKFSSNHDLANTFFVLVFNTTSPEGKYLAQGISPDELRQGKAISIEARLPAEEKIDHYEIHVFSRGLEVFNSEMPPTIIETAFDRMVAKRIKGIQNAGPKPLAGPMPRYPENLSKTKNVGRAIVTCEIAVNGELTKLAVKEATDPAFGEAALAVLPQWRFLPKIENGHAVASKAELPFDFTPPKS